MERLGRGTSTEPPIVLLIHSHMAVLQHCSICLYQYYQYYQYDQYDQYDQLHTEPQTLTVELRPVYDDCRPPVDTLHKLFIRR